MKTLFFWRLSSYVRGELFFGEHEECFAHEVIAPGKHSHERFDFLGPWLPFGIHIPMYLHYFLGYSLGYFLGYFVLKEALVPTMACGLSKPTIGIAQLELGPFHSCSVVQANE